MRTTINLPSALAEEAKRRAAEEGRTFTSLIEEALRALLARRPGATPATPLPSYGSADGRVLVDLSDPDAVWEALDAPSDDG